MPAGEDRRPHLIVVQAPDAIAYGSKGFPQSKVLPSRNRAKQGQKLLHQLRALEATSTELVAAQKALGMTHGFGIQIQFESEPSFHLKLESLELQSKGIELLSVINRNERMIATVFVPDGQLRVFLSKVQEYLERDTKSNKPSNQSLVDPIAEIRRSTLRALWTDEALPFPETTDAIWWEIWLRKGDDGAYLKYLTERADVLGLRLGNQQIDFVERAVVLVWGTADQLTKSLDLLAGIAEVRSARDTADLYSSLSVLDQIEWITDAANRLRLPQNAAAVCLLDTGMNASNPLLAPLTSSTAIQSVNEAWGADDHHGHGTSMAGVAAYGDLTPVMQGQGDVSPRCTLESCKILPPNGSNEPNLYGALTRTAIAIVELAAPRQARAFQTAITADGTITGRPSSWSAEIDALTSGAEDDQRRLFVLSVGNVGWVNTCTYPDEAHASGCEDPSQSWNALAVGGYTEKIWLDKKKWPEDYPLAPAGALCPESRTSLSWEPKWPIRPDIVLEGGNLSLNKKTAFASDLDDLSLLSTGHQYTTRPLVVTRGTSAAAAQAAGMAAELMAKYPDFWPETVKGLLVHSSTWTPAMHESVKALSGKNKYRQLLRTCGWGVPNRERALHSASNSLTLVTQETLRPYQKVKGQGTKFRDMHLHKLPWPIATLQELFDVEVQLRITLSYFIEPSPGERGYGGPFSYSSHGLRFSLQAENESDDEFRLRVNMAARDEEDDGSYVGESAGWLVGPNSRNKGSLHSDIWVGNAAALAGRHHIAIYPVVGWWRSRPHLERVDRKARYSLIVSIAAPTVTVDLYNEISQAIATPIAIDVEIG